MSSTYRAICLNHMPALQVGDPGWQSPAEAAAAIAARDGDLAEHRSCDLMIGRYSYPLIEVGCPPSIRGQVVPRTGHHYDHFTTKWLEMRWVRLLAAVAPPPGERLTGPPDLVAALDDIELCWDFPRIRAIVAMLAAEKEGAGPC